jgi:hypothetical protein
MKAGLRFFNLTTREPGGVEAVRRQSSPIVWDDAGDAISLWFVSGSAGLDGRVLRPNGDPFLLRHRPANHCLVHRDHRVGRRGRHVAFGKRS